MRSSHHLRFSWRLLALALLIGAFAIAGLGSSTVRAAASGRVLSRVRPFVGCSPCISQVSPEDPTPATIDPDGKITISFSAQLANPFAKFVFMLDGTQIDSAQIQVMDPDPTQPTGQYRTTLSAGQHQAFVQVYDSNGPAASFPWTFTVPSAPTPTATATKASGGSTDGNGGSSSNTSSGGLFSPKTLSITLFSIAGVGLLVIVFIAGMWFGGRRALRGGP